MSIIQFDEKESEIINELVENFKKTGKYQQKNVDRRQMCCVGFINFAASIYSVDIDYVTIGIYENYDIGRILRKIYNAYKDDLESFIVSGCGEDAWINLTKKSEYTGKSDLDYIHEAQGDSESFMYLIGFEEISKYLMCMKPTYLIQMPINDFTNSNTNDFENCNEKMEPKKRKLE